MHKKSVVLTGIFLGLIWILPGIAQATGTSESDAGTAAVPVAWKPVPRDLAKFDVYIDQKGGILPLDRSGMPLDNPDGYGSANTEAAGNDLRASAIGGCTPVSGRDNPHLSSTGWTASGHGWWGQGDCSNGKAKVYNCLYMKHQADGYWYQKACSDVESLKPGTGGSANRTVARRDCEHADLRSWRNHVNVDVEGEWDTGEIPMREASFVCRT